MYANATDLPLGASSGIDASTLSANVSTVSVGETAVSLTAGGVLSEGNRLYSVSASENLGTSGSSSGTNVQVDNTGPVSSIVANVSNMTTGQTAALLTTSGACRRDEPVVEAFRGSGRSGTRSARTPSASVALIGGRAQ